MNTSLDFQPVIQEAIAQTKAHWKFALLAILLTALAQMPTALPLIGPLLSLVMIGPLRVGLLNTLLRTNRGEAATYGDIFCGFKRWWKSCAVFILVSLMTVIGFMLLVVPGIILALGLLPAIFLVMDEDLGIMDTISKAWDMTKGKKTDLFVFYLLFGLIMFVCIIPLIACMALIELMPILSLLLMPLLIVISLGLVIIAYNVQIAIYERLRTAYYGLDLIEPAEEEATAEL